MVVVPAPTPVNIPDEDPTVVTVTSLLLQLPYGTELVNVVEDEGHTSAVPPITEGTSVT